ncbi:anti-sigma factor [Microbacterium marmarense]|uniref:Regulator of SigK n=1 Tax=Microbacterium marmarense TaxID=3122051 RepID=A0ABU8LT68_9MICO
MNENEFAELAAGYALGALSPEDAQIFNDARAQHPEWEKLVNDDVETVAELAGGAEATPPASIRASLLAQIAVTPQHDVDAGVALQEGMPSAATAEEQSSGEVDADVDTVFVEPTPTTTTIQAIERRNWTRGLFGLAASLVFLVALGLGAATIGEMIGPSPAVVALEQIEDAPDAQQASVDVADGGMATVHWSESVGEVVLVSDGLPSISEDQAFELWFIRGDEPPIAAGTFDASSDNSATAQFEGTMQPGDVIAVTIEEEGGSPTGEPTTDPIIVIATA